MNRTVVVGIDGSPLSDRAVRRLEEAESILASGRLLEMFSVMEGCGAFKLKVRAVDTPQAIIDFIRASSGPVAVIASGDPLFFGIGAKLLDALPGEDIEVIPAVSSVQAAFSRVPLSWHDAYFISLHGGVKRQWAAEDLPLLHDRHEKLAVLTGGGNTPPVLARLLPPGAKVHVFERLGYADERITSDRAENIARSSFKEPNIMVVLREGRPPSVTGLTAGEFESEGGLITKDEVRAVAIHKLRLPLKGVLWDIGAGTGSVSIECRRLCPGLEVYAVEKSSLRAKHIRRNALTHRAGAINVVCGEAPEALAPLPSPDRVFVGGSGGRLSEVIKYAHSRMAGGVVLVSAITLESLHEAVGSMKSCGMAPEVTALSVSSSRAVEGRHYLKAENQVFLIRGEK